MTIKIVNVPYFVIEKTPTQTYYQNVVAIDIETNETFYINHNGVMTAVTNEEVMSGLTLELFITSEDNDDAIDYS